MKIFEFNFFDGSSFFSLGTFANGSIWIDSDFFNKRSISDTSAKDFRKFDLKLNLNRSHQTTSIEFIEEQS